MFVSLCLVWFSLKIVPTTSSKKNGKWRWARRKWWWARGNWRRARGNWRWARWTWRWARAHVETQPETHTHTHATSFTFCINKHALLVEFGLSIKPRVCISALLDSTLQVSCFGLTASVPSSHSVLFPVPYRFTPNVPGIPSVVSDVPNKTHSRLHPVIPFQGGDSSKSNHCCVVSFWRILIAHNVKVTAAMQI